MEVKMCHLIKFSPKLKVFLTAVLLLFIFSITFGVCACDNESPQKKEAVLSFSLSYEEKSVSFGTSLRDALSDLAVYLDGQPISVSELSFDSDYDEYTPAKYVVTVKYGTFSAKLFLRVQKKQDENDDFENLKRLDDVANDYYDSACIPSTGNVELAVIPIGFSDRHYDGVSDLLEKAFNGTEEDTGWNSLRSFYEKSSYGKLHLHATFFPTYETGLAWDENADYFYYQRMIGDVISFGGYDLDARFDSDSDGFLDCVYFIYLAPWRECDELSPWWAYTDRDIQIMQILSDDPTEMPPQLGACVWMSIEFFDELYSVFEGTERKISTGVLIHETGHALGLPDYYDVNGSYPGVGFLNTMGGTHGDHDPFSKAILGWTDPTFVLTSYSEKILTPFEASGDTILITKSDAKTLFDEAFVFCFFTPTGVFEKDAGKQGVFSKSGVLIYHISAKLRAPMNGSIPNIYLHNNSEPPFLIRVCEADANNSIDRTGLTSNEDLFSEGATFSPKWDDGSSAGFTLRVLSVSESQATLSIIIK